MKVWNSQKQETPSRTYLVRTKLSQQFSGIFSATNSKVSWELFREPHALLPAHLKPIFDGTLSSFAHFAADLFWRVEAFFSMERLWKV